MVTVVRRVNSWNPLKEGEAGNDPPPFISPRGVKTLLEWITSGKPLMRQWQFLIIELEWVAFCADGTVVWTSEGDPTGYPCPHCHKVHLDAA